jgi:hypothetical protein
MRSSASAFETISQVPAPATVNRTPAAITRALIRRSVLLVVRLASLLVAELRVAMPWSDGRAGEMVMRSSS